MKIQRMTLCGSVVMLIFCLVHSMAQVDTRWKMNDRNRPLPPVIDPGTASTQDSPGSPPSDALVLFNGKDLSQWVGAEGQPAKWKAENGYLEVVPHSGYIIRGNRSVISNCTSNSLNLFRPWERIKDEAIAVFC